MQFDLPTPDTGPEAELPDDLQMLAEQLGEDALHLSNLYPAQSPDKWAKTASAAQDHKAAAHSASTALPWKLKRIIKWGAVAASLLVAVGLSWNFRPQHKAPAPATPPTVMDVEPIAVQPTPDESLRPESTLAIRPVSNDTVSGKSTRVQGTPDTQPVTVSTGLFMTLSSSEQEALLDLMEDEDLPQSSVSF